MALRKKKRYKAPSLTMHTKNNATAWKVIICIAVGMILSIAVFALGKHLGAQVPSGTVGETAQTTVPETEGDNDPTFQFKDNIREVISADKGVLELYGGESTAIDILSVSISDENGDLLYYSDALEYLLNNEGPKKLPALHEFVKQNEALGKRLSILFCPFTFEYNSRIALNCIYIVLDDLVLSGASEIIIDARGLAYSDIKEIASVLPERRNERIGLLVSGELMNEKNAESIIRDYYCLFDFLCFDLSHIPITASSDTAETGEETKKEDLESFMKENQLLLAKYSVRIHTVCKSVQEAERVISLAELYNACGVNLVSK